MAYHGDQHAAIGSVIQPREDDLQRERRKEVVIPGDGAIHEQRRMPDQTNEAGSEHGDKRGVREALLKAPQGVARPAWFFPPTADEYERNDHTQICGQRLESWAPRPPCCAQALAFSHSAALADHQGQPDLRRPVSGQCIVYFDVLHRVAYVDLHAVLGGAEE